MQLLKKAISDRVETSDELLDIIVSNFEILDLKKGDFFLRSGALCDKMAFIESGYLRMFDIVDGKEITLWIAGSGNFITSLSSFVFQTTNFWNIQAVTDSRLSVISRTDHLKLCKEQQKWLEFDNYLLAYSFSLLEKKMFSQLHTTAKERLENLLEQQPELFLNVPHQYIASMMGIAPESLSRLRKNITDSIS